MTQTDVVKIEEFVKQLMTKELAHGYDHAIRTRNWAVKIAVAEYEPRLDLVKAAALMHDIGLSSSTDRRLHNEVGATLAKDFLTNIDVFNAEAIEEVVYAIRYHNQYRLAPKKSKLLDIIVDADTLELLGNIGIMRAIASHYTKPLVDPAFPRGKYWQTTADVINNDFGGQLGSSDNLIDQINIQRSCYDMLTTESAKRLAQPLIERMESFIECFSEEVSTNGFELGK